MKAIFISIICGFLILTPAWADNPVKVLFEQAIEAYTAHEYPKAIAILEKINQVYPSFAPTYNYLGMCYKETGANPDEYKWLYEKAIQLDPTYADPYDNL